MFHNFVKKKMEIKGKEEKEKKKVVKMVEKGKKMRTSMLRFMVLVFGKIVFTVIYWYIKLLGDWRLSRLHQ